MQIAKWMLALIALLAGGLIAVGCGEDEVDPNTDEPATEETTPADEPLGDATEETATEGSTPEDVLATCEDVIEGTEAESAGQSACQAAADAFELCLDEAEKIDSEDARETALKACEDAADEAVSALEATGGG